METNEITLPQIIELLPETISLNYVDYRESFDEHATEMQTCLQANSLDALCELANDWYIDQGWDSVEQFNKEQLRPSLMKSFELSEKKAKKLIKLHFDDIRCNLEDRDDSDVVKDLLGNTGKMIFFYETGISASGYDGGKSQHRLDRMKIKKLLSITNSDFDNRIDSMLSDASYGGQLVIYFRKSLNSLIVEEDTSHIRFTNATIAIIDTCNGSGGDCTIGNKHTFLLPLVREKLFVEKAVSYNYTYQVCGLTEDWCDSTKFEFVDAITDTTIKLEEGKIGAHLQTEKFLDAVWAKGICTPGDMKLSRHNETEYINDYPCGTRCNKCGTFWID
jgi:hypothetical protein